jgi:hypothetical protein
MKETAKKQNIFRVADFILFASLLIALAFFFGQLVYAQALYAGKEGGYFSDIYAYMQEMQGIDSGYSFPYPVLFLTGRFFDLFLPIEMAVTLAEVLFNSLAVLITKYYLEKYINEYVKKITWQHFAITISIFACFLMSMWWLPRFGKITLPLKDQAFYGTYSGNPWHNATYIATRPFAIGAFFSFINLFKDEDKCDWKKGIVFGIFLFLTTMTKPSFTLVIGSAMAIVCVIRLIGKKFKNIKYILFLFICSIPTLIALLLQFGGVFGSGNTEAEHGIGLDFFRVWRSANPHVLAAIFYANVFALVCIPFLIKNIRKDYLYKFTLIIFAVSVLEAGLLCEKGFRYSHFNFSWGYMHGIFFFALGSIAVLLKNIFEKKIKPVFAIICIIALLSQVVFGILYFKGLYYGRDYNTLLPYNWL